METLNKKINLKMILILSLLSLVILGEDTLRINASTDEYDNINSTSAELITLEHVEEPNDHYRLFDDFINQLSQEQIDNAEKAEAERLAEIERRKKEIERKTIKASRYVSTSEISEYTDLSIMRDIDADQINKVIKFWANRCGGSTFIGHGQAFIDAAKETGLDPIYILAHAGLESAWGKSQIAVDKHNYFGIGAIDTNPYGGAKVLVDSIDSGIIAGATWIKNNFYNAGQTSLYTMRNNNGGHEYCTSTTWVYSITELIRTSYSLLD